MFEKGLVYQGYKVMPYSTACNTPLSNFEAGLNYKDVRDPAVTVAFPVDGPAGSPHVGARIVAWTTTPWTLPSNLALCVNAGLTSRGTPRGLHMGFIRVGARCPD